MKSIDIMGVFSKADVPLNEAQAPVLYKIIESAIKEEYDINRICLFDIYNEKEYFEKSCQIIFRSLKKIYPDYDFDNLEKVHYIENVRDVEKINNGIVRYHKNIIDQPEISDYIEYFRESTQTSKSDAIYYNLVSGNVQSKESLQICIEYFSTKENFIYSDSRENKELSHKICKELFDFCNDKDIGDIVNNKYADLNNRIVFKKDIYNTLEAFHNAIIANLIDNEKYFEMYYHYDNYKDIFNTKNYEEISAYFKTDYKVKGTLDNITKNKFNTKEAWKISKRDLAKYFLNRLVFIKFKIIENYKDRILLKNIERLLFTLYHLEKCDHVEDKVEKACPLGTLNKMETIKKTNYVEDKGDFFLIDSRRIVNNNSTTYFNCIDKYFELKNGSEKISNGERLFNIDLNGITKDQLNVLINDLNDLYKSERHKNKKYKKKWNSIELLVKQLEEKFNNEYIKYLNIDEKTFKECFNEKIECFKNNIIINKDKIEKLSKKEISDNVCFLSMSGSTDPINVKKIKGEYDFNLGSFLTFKYGVKHFDESLKVNDNKKLLKQLHDINEENEIQSYFIMSKESIEILFNPKNEEGHLELNQMDNIYKGPITIVPFAKDSNDKELMYDNITSQDYSYDLDSLLNMKSYSEVGYTLEICSKIIKKIMSPLLKKYDNIIILESSGIPHVKMALSFMTLMYPTKIIPYMITNPYSKSDNTINIIDYDIVNKDVIIKPKESNVSILSNISETNEDRNFLISYLTQGIKYEDDEDFFKSNNFDNIRKEIEDHDKVDLEKDEITKTARILCKSYYLYQFGFRNDSIECLDKVFEVIFGDRLREFNENNGYMINLDKINIEKLDKIYDGCIKNLSKNKVNRPNGIFNAIKYACNKENLLNKVKGINDAWEHVSSLKHGKEPDTMPVINREYLEGIASFYDEVKEHLEEEFKYYEMIINCFPQF